DCVAVRVLGLAHRPHDGARPVLGHLLRHVAHFRFLHAGHLLDFFRRPLRDFLAHLVHAIYAVVDVLLVFPAVLEDVVQHAPQEGDVRAGAGTVVGVGLGRRPRPTRIAPDNLGAVLLGDQRVQHRHRMRFGRVAAEGHDAFGIQLIVVRVGHRAVATGVRDTGYGGGVADARLVVHVVGAEHGYELAE